MVAKKAMVHTFLKIYSLTFCDIWQNFYFYHTVKPVLSGHRIKRTPSIKRTVAEVPKFTSLIYFKWNLY